MKLSKEDENLGRRKQSSFALHWNYFYLQKTAGRNSLSSSQCEERQSEVACLTIVTTNISARSPEIFFTELVAVQMRYLKEKNREKTSIIKKSIPKQNTAGDEGKKKK